MPRTSTDLVLAASLWGLLVASHVLRPPSPQGSISPWDVSVQALAWGSHPRSATVAWWRLGRRWTQRDPVDAQALAETVRHIGALDPRWRTPWIYGGLMLQTLDEPAAPALAEALLSEGAARWPEDPWFPAALGVHLQDQGRVEEARAWLRAARERP